MNKLNKKDFALIIILAIVLAVLPLISFLTQINGDAILDTVITWPVTVTMYVLLPLFVGSKDSGSEIGLIIWPFIISPIFGTILWTLTFYILTKINIWLISPATFIKKHSITLILFVLIFLSWIYLSL